MSTEEETIYTIVLPYFITLKGKKYPCNLNKYKSLHYRITNEMKKEFKELITDDVIDLPVMERIKIHYVIHYENKRSFDIDNIMSVVCKFAQDALVELGRLPDDNFKHIVQITGTVGYIDKDNPHIEMRIKEI